MFEQQVYFVGLRYKHHAQHSGYEAFGRYIGTALKPPVGFRWTLGKWGWTLNQTIARCMRHPWYSLGAHLTEWSAFMHMLRHRNCLYHILYGDSDLWLLRRANKLSGNRLIASFHQPTSDLRELGVIERVARHLDAVILVSQAQRAYFEDFLSAERIFVVPHGVDTAFFRPAERPSEKPVCITVGSHLRDFDTLKQAFQLIWQANPDVQIVAVGTRSDKKSYFPELDDERIIFLDKISDEALLQAYQSAKVAIFSFKEATANNAMLEAMASGLPVVATDRGTLSEYVVDGTGLLCPPRDPQALAAATLRLLGDLYLQTKMAAASRRHAVGLDFRVVADQMCTVYSNVLQAGRRKQAAVHSR